MSWSSRQRTKYVAGFAVLFVLAVVIPLMFSLYEGPSCFDGLQNGQEEGVDCGGVCAKICSFQRVDPVVRWSRVFEVSPGFYNAVAFVENPNFDVDILSMPYLFSLRDENNLLIYERAGMTYVPPKSVFPVFETALQVGERVPKRVFFEFTAVPDWRKATVSKIELVASQSALTDADTSPRLTATLDNLGDVDVNDVEVVAVLYDIDGNAVGASRTYVDRLMRRSATTLTFTWPQPFTAPIARIEVLPRVVE